MSDVNTQPAKLKRETRSERGNLGADGKVIDTWMGARGFSYTSLEEQYTAEVMFKDYSEDAVFALAAFGGRTLAGNITNTVRNGKGTGGPATEKEALIAWLSNLAEGNWSEPTGEVEAGMSNLAKAYCAAWADAGTIIDVEVATAKLKAADKEKRAAIRKNPQVKAHLAKMAADRATEKAKESAPALEAL